MLFLWELRGLGVNLVVRGGGERRVLNGEGGRGGDEGR